MTQLGGTRASSPQDGAIPPVVALRDVTMTFQSVVALRGVTLEAPAGKVLSLIHI